MNNIECRVAPDPLEIEQLLSADERRPRRLTVAEHEAFRRSLISPADDLDEIEVADIDPPQRRSEREASRVLNILDQLERSGG